MTINLPDMTTKEFLRRSDYYQILDVAIMYHPELSKGFSIFKVTCISSSRTFVTFCDSPLVFFNANNSVDISNQDSIYFERYTYQQLLVDLRYFKAFLSRLSKYQLESLKASGKCSHLLDFVHNNNSNF